jgi:DNA-directed RNA polymerase subunit RPC12/RpoP
VADKGHHDVTGDIMARFFDALKAGVKGFKQGTEPSEYSVAGRPVRCPHCGEGKFAPASALLNTRGLSAFNLDWADPSATILVCAECGRIEWYAHEPTETSN